MPSRAKVDLVGLAVRYRADLSAAGLVRCLPECGSRWPRLSKISRERRELYRPSEIVSKRDYLCVGATIGNPWEMAELLLPQYYREQALRLRQMARAASSPITRLEYAELAAYYEKLTEDVEHLIEQRRRKSA